jgi:hypothetical protein
LSEVEKKINDTKSKIKKSLVAPKPKVVSKEEDKKEEDKKEEVPASKEE